MWVWVVVGFGGLVGLLVPACCLIIRRTDLASWVAAILDWGRQRIGEAGWTQQFANIALPSVSTIFMRHPNGYRKRSSGVHMKLC